MTIIIQPYYFWKGHYKRYFKALVKNNSGICVGAKDKKLKKNNIYFLKPLFSNYEKNGCYFLFSRLFNSLKVLFFLFSKFFFKKKNKSFHFIDFEPVTFILLIILNIFFRKKLIFTVHSTKFANRKNLIINFLAISQKFFLVIFFLISNFSNCVFVVHKKEDKLFIKKFYFKKKLFIFDYPCEYFQIKPKKKKKNNTLIIFGQIRKDKNFLDFFKKYNALKYLTIIIIGKFYDKEFYKYIIGKKNINVINKFYNDKELKKHIDCANYSLFPYAKNYTGSVGPLKESLSYGCPVICSNNKFFKDFLKKNKVGFLFGKNTLSKINKLKSNEYLNLSKNCLLYAKKNNWNSLEKKYDRIFNS